MENPDIDSVDPKINPTTPAKESPDNSGSIPQVPPTIENKQEATHCKPDQTPLWKIILETFAVVVGIVVACIYYGQLKEMRKATTASEKAAAAAASAATTASQTLTDQQESFRDDQRPWIAIWQSHMYFESQIPLGAQIEIVNVGKTPALHVTEAATRFIWHPPILSGPTSKLISELVFHNAAPVPPQGKTAISMGDANRQQQPLADDWRSITNGSQILYNFGEVRYEDTFGRTHSTRFCFYLANPGTTNVMAFCKGYNDMN